MAKRQSSSQGDFISAVLLCMYQPTHVIYPVYTMYNVVLSSREVESSILKTIFYCMVIRLRIFQTFDIKMLTFSSWPSLPVLLYAYQDHWHSGQAPWAVLQMLIFCALLLVRWSFDPCNALLWLWEQIVARPFPPVPRCPYQLPSQPQSTVDQTASS